MEPTRLLHRQSNVTQHLCLTVDSTPLTENVLRSTSSTVSPTFSIADILASSYPDSTGERNVPDAGQAYKEALVVPDQHAASTVSAAGQIAISFKPQSEDLSQNQTCIESTTCSSQSTALLVKLPTIGTKQPAIMNQTNALVNVTPETDMKPLEPVLTTCPSTKLLVVNSSVHPTELSSNQSCDRRLTRSKLVQVNLVATRQDAATETDPVKKPAETDSKDKCSSLVEGFSHESLDDLVDAARCLRAETQLQEAESVVDALIAKFAEPLDLYTAWENLHRPNPITVGGVRPATALAPCSTSSLSSSSSSFSPIILPLILAQSESTIFPQLCQPSSTGRKLFELCKQLAGDILRLKRKLRVLHRARIRRSTSVSSRPAATLGHKPTAATASTISERRSAFLRQLNAIWPEHPTTPEDDVAQDTYTPVHRPTDRPPVVPCIYTNPMECPLSLLSFVSESLDAIHPNSQSRARADGFDHYGRELTIQITSAESGQRSPAALSSCPSLSDTHTFPSVESPHLPAFSLLSPSLSPSSCSTISGSGIASRSLAMTSHPCKPGVPQRREIQCKDSTVCKIPKPSDSTSWSSSSGSSQFSSRRRQKRSRRGGRQGSGKSQPGHKNKNRRIRDSIQVVSRASPTSAFSPPLPGAGNSGISVAGGRCLGSDRELERAPELQLPCPIQTSGLNRFKTKWEQLRVVVRDPHSALLLQNGAESDSLIAPDLSSPMDLNRPAVTTAPCSAPCVSFFESRSMKSDEDSQMTDTASRFHHHDSHELDDSGAFSSSDEPNWVGDGQNSINTRPPTPDIRRSDLDLADLSDGTRVLIIQDTHLRAGTLYLGSTSSATSPASISLSTGSLSNQLFRIHLDTERQPTYQHNQGIHRFASLPSPSRVSSFSGSSATVLHPARRTSSPARSGISLAQTSRSPTTSGTPKKRRQSDLILYGWQVVQQAVLEVFPASVRHVPPGTRVCAAWSEQLAAELYPGTVAEAEPKEQIQHNCVPVGFDDGDRRQVPIHNIRILPDNFTNLYELASATHAAGGLVSDLLQLPNTSLSAPTSRGIAFDHHRRGSLTHATEKLSSSSLRVRHHSAMDHHRPTMRKTTNSPPLTGSSDSVRVKRMDRVTCPTHSSSETAATTTGLDTVQTDPKMKGVKSPQHEEPDPLTDPTEPTGNLEIHEHESEIEKSTTYPIQPQPCELMAGAETDLPHESTDKDEKNTSDDYSVEKPRIRSPSQPESLAPGDSKMTNQHSRNNHANSVGSPIMENDTLSDSLSTTSTSSDHPTWHILDKVRRRKHGRIFCRSIVRQTDGLVISIGDSVEFSSGHDDVYLGEVRAIRWDEAMDAPVVTAAWYYNLNEAGEEGQLIMQLKDAVFATEHHDENEARCIVRRAVVAPSYAAYQAMIAGEPGACDTTSTPLIKTDPDASQSKTMVDSKTDHTYSASRSNGADHVNGLTVTAEPMDTGPDQQRKLSDDSSISEESEEAALYFIAGKYDPVHRRVIAWDPDVARMIKSP